MHPNKIVRSVATLLCSGLLAAVTAAAQTPAQPPAAPPSDPLSLGQKGIYAMVKSAVLRAAEKMPEEEYAFKPTPDVRSFGQLVGHTADAQYMFCAAAMGEKPTPMGVEKGKTSKADLVQALKDAVAYCDKAYDGMTDAESAKMVKFFGRDMAKLTVLSFNSAHTDEHYGNMVTYMRMKGVVPPTSEPRK